MARSVGRGPIGLENGRVRLVPYSPAWPMLYATELARIEPFVAAASVELVIEHIGSTAVHGLVAKPIIDLLVGLHVERDRPAAIDALQSAGYEHRGQQDIPGRDFFRRGDPRQYHLHLALIDSRFWTEHRLFRDWLCAHPATAAEYAALKHQLAARFPTDRPSYIRGKTEFVRGVVEMAGRTQPNEPAPHSSRFDP